MFCFLCQMDTSTEWNPVVVALALALGRNSFKCCSVLRNTAFVSLGCCFFSVVRLLFLLQEVADSDTICGPSTVHDESHVVSWLLRSSPRSLSLPLSRPVDCLAALDD